MSGTDDLAKMDRLLVLVTRIDERQTAMVERFDAHETRSAESVQRLAEDTDEKVRVLRAEVRSVRRKVDRIAKIGGTLSALGAAIAGALKIKTGSGQ